MDNPNLDQIEMGKSYQIFKLMQCGEPTELEIKGSQQQGKSSPQICKQFETCEWWSLSAATKAPILAALDSCHYQTRGHYFMNLIL